MTTFSTFSKYTFTVEETALLHSVISDHTQALKNWIISALERDDVVHAKELVKELRKFQELYAKTNVKVHAEIGVIPE